MHETLENLARSGRAHRTLGDEALLKVVVEHPRLTLRNARGVLLSNDRFETSGRATQAARALSPEAREEGRGLTLHTRFADPRRPKAGTRAPRETGTRPRRDLRIDAQVCCRTGCWCAVQRPTTLKRQPPGASTGTVRTAAREDLATRLESIRGRGTGVKQHLRGLSCKSGTCWILRLK